MKRIVLVFALSILFSNQAFSQRFALKSNALYALTSTPNIGAELAVSQRVTLNLTGGVFARSFSGDKSFKHWMIQPEVRFWTSEKYKKLFFGVHGVITNYDIAYARLPFGIFKNRRYDGEGYGGGLTCGYNLPLSSHWNLELVLGLGYIHFEYDKYWSGQGYPMHMGYFKNEYFGLTKLGASFAYVF
ncbi:DUF3575 domain-containing protein [Parabacteroides sp. OttesenSCG-928-G07]|nr:DUF3575 domain-containing protein [Parabacteroides sp. OttesenSCG-928-G21]MDL2278340.1 DUF3575 domain-containing protein [Parabacteroides sp. OttesenSCG-928-G07]